LRDGKGKHFDPRCVDAFFQNWHVVLEIKSRFADEPAMDPQAAPAEVHA